MDKISNDNKEYITNNLSERKILDKFKRAIDG